MRAIVVEDEAIMLKSFLRLSKGIPDLDIVATFEMAEDAVAYAETHHFELAFLDIEMPGMNGIECAKVLREKMPGLLIVFVSAYDDYLRESNEIGGDDYLLKPYTTEIIEKSMEKMRLLVRRQRKNIHVQMFGRFVVTKDGTPVPLRGKAKEILALILVKHGKEISNEEIYTTIWEERGYSNVQMKVYYNALRRLKDTLKVYEIQEILISTARGHMANTDAFDCDYYTWMNRKMRADEMINEADQFEGEFLSEYSWGEYILGNIMTR